MIQGKWHFRKVRGRWQGVRRTGCALEVKWLEFPPAFFMCPKHGPMIEGFEVWMKSKLVSQGESG